MPKRARKTGKAKKGSAQNRDEPEQSLPTMPHLSGRSSRHARPVERTFSGVSDMSISEESDSTFRPLTRGSADCLSAAVSASLNNVVNNLVTSALPQAQNAAVDHCRYSFRYARSVSPRPKPTSFRIATRFKQNETFIDSAANSLDGSTTLMDVPIAEKDPQGHSSEEGNPDPPSEHLKPATDNFGPTVATPAACNSTSQGDSNLNPVQSVSVTLSEMVNLMDDGSSSQSEVSFRGQPLVTVEGYRVKEEVAPTLRRILSKHGDIAANCSYRQPKLRSSLLENFCEILHELEALEFTKVTIDRLKSIRELVDDLKDDLNVSWVLERLDDIMIARQLVSSLIEERKKIKQETEEIETENEALTEKLGVNQEKLTALKAEITTVNTIFSEAKEKVKRFYRRPLVDDLL